MATATEQATPTIPGSENMNMSSSETSSLQRLHGYPVVKDTLDHAYSLVQSNPYSSAAYTRVEALSQSLLARLEPLQKRLPLETVDGYAQAGLDYVEKKFPGVKAQTNVIVDKAWNKPTSEAYGVAKTYADGIQSRISPVTDQLSARIGQTQESLHALQGRLSAAVANVPRDKASAQEAINSIFRELESLSHYITTHAAELPAQAQATAKPLLEGFSEGLTYIRDEITKPDVPLSTKAHNILSYTQDKVSPLLNSIKDLVTKKKTEVEHAAKETPFVNGNGSS